MSYDRFGGTFVDKVHVFPVRIYFEDTDAGGVVYHANYLQFAERARTEMLRAVGLQQSELMAEEGIAFVVRRCRVDFLVPGRLDDRLQVASRLLGVRGASVVLQQDVQREAVDLVRMRIKLACMARSGRPARIPDRVRTALAEYSLEHLWTDDGEHGG